MHLLMFRTLSAALLAVGALAPAGLAQLVFEPPQSAGPLSYTRRVLVGDLDEDGLPDLVTSRYSIFPISLGPPTISFGLGGGQFGPPQALPFGNVFRLADFNADGHLDLLLGGGGTANNQAVSVVFGDGRGSFGPALGISTGDSSQDPDDAAVGDLNGDGALDVVVHRGIEPFLFGRIMIIFGNGDGTFGTPFIVVPFASTDPAHHGRIEVGDVDGDGELDIVYTTGHSSPVLLGQGGGAFAFGPCTGTGCGVTTDRDFVVRDVNGDGRADAVTNQRVLLADSDGVFATGQIFSASFVPYTVALGDLDSDGIDDVVLGRNGIAAEFDATATLGDVLMLRGLGDGTYQTPGLVVSHVPQPRDVAVADLDGDGAPEVAVALFQATAAVRVLTNHTYAPGSPFLDLGAALAGSAGAPIQLADGTLVGGEPFSFRLANGPANGAAFHFIGLSALNAPFKGGTLIPALNLVNGPLPLDASGGIALAGIWPSGASGVTLWLQFWMPNGGGPAGLVASSGVRAQIP